MIAITLRLENPWGKGNFDSLFSKSGSISKNKAWEFEVYRGSTELAEFAFSFSFRGKDHAGLKLDFGLFGYSVNFLVYDTRHWDYKNDCWEKYDGNIS